MKNLSDSEKLLALVVAVSKYYGAKLEDDVARLYASDLADLPFAQVEAAYASWRRNPTNVRAPLPAGIRAIVQPRPDDKSVAVDLAKKLGTLLSKHGAWWPKTSRPDGGDLFIGAGKEHPTLKAALVAEFGELGFEVVERRGGWHRMHIEFTQSEPGVFNAQLRDHIQAVMDLARSGQLHRLPSLPQPARRAELAAPAQQQVPKRIGAK